jgi:hypothetical protein
MYIPNVNSILAAGLALTGGSGLMKKRTFNPFLFLFLFLFPSSLFPSCFPPASLLHFIIYYLSLEMIGGPGDGGTRSSGAGVTWVVDCG